MTKYISIYDFKNLRFHRKKLWRHGLTAHFKASKYMFDCQNLFRAGVWERMFVAIISGDTGEEQYLVPGEALNYLLHVLPSFLPSNNV